MKERDLKYGGLWKKIMKDRQGNVRTDKGGKAVTHLSGGFTFAHNGESFYINVYVNEWKNNDKDPDYKFALKEKAPYMKEGILQDEFHVTPNPKLRETPKDSVPAPKDQAPSFQAPPMEESDVPF